MKFHILRIESVKKKKEQQPKSNKIYEGTYTPLPGQGTGPHMLQLRV